MLFTCTYGAEDPERATVPFIAANVAVVSGQATAVVCTSEAVRLGVEGGTDGVRGEGLPVLADLVAEFVANGGRIWLCSACTNARGITEDDCAEGARIVGAATIVAEVAEGAKSISLT